MYDLKLTSCKSMDQRIKLMKETVHVFSSRAYQHDKQASFPFENMKDLIAIEYTGLTIPQQYGGMGISLYEMLKHQEIIAKADGSTALSIGWHMGIMKNLGENNIWGIKKYRQLANLVLNNGALINNSATEPATGSPTRGGKPETTAKKTNNGWKINGRKTFTTMAPMLTHFNVSATIEDTGEVGDFLIQHYLPGVIVEETWDAIAMRATGSHDLILKDVVIAESDFVNKRTPGKKSPQGWLLHIPACYLGIAKAAQEVAVNFAKSYSPNSINTTISEIPTVKQKLGEIELKLVKCTHFLYSVANKWDKSNSLIRETMQPELGAVKYEVVNEAIHVIDLAMRIVGARSLSEKNPLQRYYRDVRAGLHNPPMDDMTLMQLANQSLQRIKTE
ncbi:acyl-CoA dehydrogenase family protein [Virgibacillus soli]|uniref:Acyl-CoA dehydrogenase family protein n=1 Tax=Paracerasibacillus soli TaxID=480284 RepID=A0ABU5CNQ7_9BACI|nr:acyl-CoA dehydrogenase family protein [Virgibacillus soli]MDY0407992.1 acyl-CoA dehydrogenase family protein [Virgibacillus soli]